MARLLLRCRAVSQARPIYRNTSLMLTRRVRGRRFLLRPSQKTNQVVRYVVAVMAAKWRIGLHAITVMSNHWHLCATDTEGNIAEFQRDCHAFVARGLNAAHGEFESVWSGGQGSRVECTDVESIISQIAYTMANPVEAGLVRHGTSWPGVRHAWPRKPVEVKRPPRFFRGPEVGGEWPERVLLEFTRPPGYDGTPDDVLAAAIENAIREREDRFRSTRDVEKLRFLGRRAVLSQQRHSRPKEESRSSRFKSSPKIAGRDKWRRIERLASDRAWGIAYRLARMAWCLGNRSVVFPHGTYKMRIVHDCVCEPEPG